MLNQHISMQTLLHQMISFNFREDFLSNTSFFFFCFSLLLLVFYSLLRANYFLHKKVFLDCLSAAISSLITVSAELISVLFVFLLLGTSLNS